MIKLMKIKYWILLKIKKIKIITLSNKNFKI